MKPEEIEKVRQQNIYPQVRLPWSCLAQCPTFFVHFQFQFQTQLFLLGLIQVDPYQKPFNKVEVAAFET